MTTPALKPDDDGRIASRPRGRNGRLLSMDPSERFWVKVNRDGANGCWLWAASVGPTGYGQFHYFGRTRKAHQVSFEWMVGPIPNGLVLDHLCRTPLCVNPAHLEPVTPRENAIRGMGVAGRARDTHCKRGHPFEGDNLIFKNGRRCCRACVRFMAKRWERSNRGAVR